MHKTRITPSDRPVWNRHCTLSASTQKDGHGGEGRQRRSTYTAEKGVHSGEGLTRRRRTYPAEKDVNGEGRTRRRRRSTEMDVPVGKGRKLRKRSVNDGNELRKLLLWLRGTGRLRTTPTGPSRLRSRSQAPDTEPSTYISGRRIIALWAVARTRRGSLTIWLSVGGTLPPDFKVQR